MYGEFTIRETMVYFGWVAGMTTREVDEKLEFLINLLQLPPSSRAVKNLRYGEDINCPHYIIKIIYLFINVQLSVRLL